MDGGLPLFCCIPILMTEVYLSMRNINKRYAGVKALDAVDFEIYQGEIHCLVGENGSGKSTLIKIISGAVQPDEGAQIEINGKPLHGYQAIDAIHMGVEVIYQDLSLFPNLTVAENIALGEWISAGKQWVDWPEMQRIARQAMDRIEISLPLDDLVGDISIADQQLVAICRALTRDVRLLIMDEPTASLTRKEVDALFAVVKDLQSKDIATLFVSHKLDEVLQIAERVTVLRDGKKIGVYPSKELDDEKLTMLMVGRKLEYTPYSPALSQAQPLLEVRGLGKRGNFKDISFQVRPGEILGITGLLGSGRTELAMALFGVDPADEGEIIFEGRQVTIRSVQDAIRLGIACVPENRLLQGLVMPQAVDRNIVITIIDRLRSGIGLVNDRDIQKTADQWVKSLAIKIPALDAPVQTLSGGNQQRVVLSKWIATQPRLLILDGPTIGVDVAAKQAIHEIVRGLAAHGLGIILISDEVLEVFNNSNRVVVMHRGRQVAEFDTARATPDEITQRIQTSD
jgi:simple sugar transport system ATP-binding protein